MTILLEILAVAAVVFGIAAYVVGHLDGMSEAPPDTGDDGLPPGRLAPGMVDRARFGLAFRGYRMAEVDVVLDRLRDELADRDAELGELRGAGEQSVAVGDGDGEAADVDGQLALGEQ
ncbi:MAG TPA: DivIVA domain-containing protein [Mycobacteriales bacterium]